MHRILITALLLTGAVSAQPPTGGVFEATFSGFVEKITLSRPAAPPCFLPAHQLRCSNFNVLLQSSTINLDELIGRNVELTGTSLFQCPNTFEVTSFRPAPVQLTFCGTPGLGCPVRLRSTPGALSQHFLFLSASPGLFPIDPQAGSVLLGPPIYVFGVQAGGAAQGVAFDFVIPSIPALTGVELFFQSARRDIGPVGPIQFSNAVCFTIPGFVFVCHPRKC